LLNLGEKSGLVLPAWGLLQSSGDSVDTNLRNLSELTHTLRTKIDGEVNPSILEAERDKLDREIDDLTFDLYGMNAEERGLVLNSIPE
jgi:hypothetical protein